MQGNDNLLSVGAILDLGLRYCMTGNKNMVYKMKELIYSEKANAGEVAGYSIGLINATHYDD